MKGCRPLSDPELQMILEKLGGNQNPLRDRALFLLGVRTGFRISELLSIKVGDFFQNGNYAERITIARRYMKGKKDSREVLLHREAREALETWVKILVGKGSDSGTYIFQSRQGENKPMNRRSAWATLKKAYKACGLTGKLGTHSMRKTFAKRMYEKLGHDLMKTQKALGQRRITSTVSYLSFTESEIDDAILKS